MEILQPAHAELGLFQVEQSCIDNLADVDFAVARFEDRGAVVERFDNVTDAGSCLTIDLDKGPVSASQYEVGTRATTAGSASHRVCLVENNDVGEFDLVNHEVRHGALILGDHVIAPLRKQLIGVEVVEHGEGVNDGDGGVELGELLQAADRGSVNEGEYE